MHLIFNIEGRNFKILKLLEDHTAGLGYKFLLVFSVRNTVLDEIHSFKQKIEKTKNVFNNLLM